MIVADSIFRITSEAMQVMQAEVDGDGSFHVE